MAETIQEMIARKRREKAEGVKPTPVVDNEAARRNMVTAVSTANRSDERISSDRATNDQAQRTVVSLQDSKTKDIEVEKSTGQKLIEDRKKRAQAKAYIEANSK